MSRRSASSLLAATMVAASLGLGAWKVVEVRSENVRLAHQARTCMARNEAFLALVRTAAEGRRATPGSTALPEVLAPGDRGP